MVPKLHLQLGIALIAQILSKLEALQTFFPNKTVCRYFLRKLRKVKKANGQILSINEASFPQDGAGQALALRLSSQGTICLLARCTQEAIFADLSDHKSHSESSHLTG